jgi:hypothetical protein
MKDKCKCGFCEDELVKDCLEPSFCQPCEITFIQCKTCGTSYSDKLALCPECNKKKNA